MMHEPIIAIGSLLFRHTTPWACGSGASYECESLPGIELEHRLSADFRGVWIARAPHYVCGGNAFDADTPSSALEKLMQWVRRSAEYSLQLAETYEQKSLEALYP